ncbi:MAG: hypothetical protein RLZZ522_1312, partial [Verrucomicrobiota bacterium]
MNTHSLSKSFVRNISIMLSLLLAAVIGIVRVRPSDPQDSGTEATSR